jgi:uncharacterized membrane protein YgcG
MGSIFIGIGILFTVGYLVYFFSRKARRTYLNETEVMERDVAYYDELERKASASLVGSLAVRHVGGSGRIPVTPPVQQSSRSSDGLVSGLIIGALVENMLNDDHNNVAPVDSPAPFVGDGGTFGGGGASGSWDDSSSSSSSSSDSSSSSYDSGSSSYDSGSSSFDSGSSSSDSGSSSW